MRSAPRIALPWFRNEAPYINPQVKARTAAFNPRSLARTGFFFTANTMADTAKTAAAPKPVMMGITAVPLIMYIPNKTAPMIIISNILFLLKLHHLHYKTSAYLNNQPGLGL